MSTNDDDDDEPYSDGTTAAAGLSTAGDVLRSFQLAVADGPATGTVFTSRSDRCSIGSHESNDLVIADPTVSRFHSEVRLEGRRARVRDLRSRNGTFVDGTGVVDGFLRDGSLLRLGNTVIRFESAATEIRIPLSTSESFGDLVGVSAAMRGLFAVLERAARTSATVLLEGETGTGKEAAATSIHGASDRRDGPFVVVDCGRIPAALLESELFGHERGAFTGAAQRRIGAFEEAHGGTLFLDEIGELPADLQPKLLRALEQRTVRRVGSNTSQEVDIRVIAATNRDLRHEVNTGEFRPDLYFRLAVVKIALPPLRSRPEDVPVLAARILSRLGAPRELIERLLGPDLERLQRAAWPGNVRELRNYLERCLVFEQPVPLGATQIASDADTSGMSYDEARRAALAAFERRYIEGLLARHGGRVAAAAQEAGIDRVYLYRLMRRHGLTAR